MGSIELNKDERIIVLEKAIKYYYYNNLISYKEIEKLIDNLNIRNISNILRYYRQNNIVINKERLLLNQMITNNNYIPNLSNFDFLSGKSKQGKVVGIEKNYQKEILDGKSIEYFIKKAEKKLEEAKKYIKIVTDKIQNKNE